MAVWLQVNVEKESTSKIRAFGPGLETGIVGCSADFTVETNGESGALGMFSLLVLHTHSGTLPYLYTRSYSSLVLSHARPYFPMPSGTLPCSPILSHALWYSPMLTHTFPCPLVLSHTPMYSGTLPYSSVLSPLVPFLTLRYFQSLPYCSILP